VSFLNKRLLRNFDVTLVTCVVVICLFSLVVIASASRSALPTGADPFTFVKRQAVWFLLGIVVFFIVASMDYSDFARYSRIIYWVNLALLFAVLVKGRSALGAQRWIGPLQPSELAKIAIIITLGTFLADRKGKINGLIDLVPVFAHIAIPMVLILKQPDLGTSLVFVAITFGMLFMAGAPARYVLGLGLGGLATVVRAIWLHLNRGLPLPLKDYQINRLIVFLNPKLDPLNSGYHVIQSKIAVGSGGLWGKGLFAGTQSGLNFLPEQHTDFIFSVIAEETGFVICIGLLALYFLVLWRAVRIMAYSRDQFGSLLAAGIISMLSFHVLINVGMTMGAMPITGIPLPFVSYGGNSLITNIVGIALLESIAMRKQKIMF